MSKITKLLTRHIMENSMQSIERPLFSPKTLQRENIDGRRLYTMETGEKFVSITTLLNYFNAPSIQAWRKRVGETEANAVSKKATTSGTRLHNAIECFLEDVDPSKYLQTEGDRSGYNNIVTYLKEHLDETWYVENMFFSRKLKVAGQADLIGVLDGVPTVIDFKTSRKFKKREWCESYFQQATFYAMALYEMAEIPVKDIAILISVNDGENFVVYKEKVSSHMNSLYDKVKRYHAAHELSTNEKEETVA